jgi:hypothetical protein
MGHPIHSVKSFEIIGEHALNVWFEDNTMRTIDFTPILAGELFGPLNDVHTFRQVRLDPEAHTLVWPCGADFDPAILYDWPRYAAQYAAHAEQWRYAQT